MIKTSRFILFFLLLFSGFRSLAQTQNLALILAEYPSQFAQLKTEPLTSDFQTEVFGSRLCISGAEQCTITKYSSEGKPVYSFEARMPVQEDFSIAKRQFKQLFIEVQTVEVNLGGKLVKFKGTYTEPKESNRFNSIILTPDTREKNLRNLKIEVLLEADMLEWRTRLIVYEREREDNERGSATEN